MDINFQLEEKIRIIIENKISGDNFNDFAVEFYLLTKKIMISLNKFLNIIYFPSYTSFCYYIIYFNIYI